ASVSLGELLAHAREVPHLLAGERQHVLGEEVVVGVAADEGESRRGRLELAVGVVGEDAVHVLRHEAGPRGIRGGEARQPCVRRAFVTRGMVIFPSFTSSPFAASRAGQLASSSFLASASILAARSAGRRQFSRVWIRSTGTFVFAPPASSSSARMSGTGRPT